MLLAAMEKIVSLLATTIESIYKSEDQVLQSARRGALTCRHGWSSEASPKFYRIISRFTWNLPYNTLCDMILDSFMHRRYLLEQCDKQHALLCSQVMLVGFTVLCVSRPATYEKVPAPAEYLSHSIYLATVCL